MSMNTAISSSSRLLLKKPDVDLDLVPKNTIVSVKTPCFSSSPSSVLSFMSNVRRGAVQCASMVEEKNPVLSSGVLFQPFEEVKREEFLVPISPQTSLARQNYFDDCEAAINEQINVEYNVSYVYHALYAYFDRDNVAMKGFAKFFKESSDEEREHAEKLMKYQNMRGGRVKLHTIVGPPSEFEHVEKGDALYDTKSVISVKKGAKSANDSGVSSGKNKSKFSITSVENGGVSASVVVLSSPVEAVNGMRFEDLLIAPAELMGREKHESMYKVIPTGGIPLVVKII